MSNTQTLKGNWNEIKGKIQEKWGQVSGDDLDRAEGNADQLIGLIQRKTGEAREDVANYIENLTGSASSVASQAAETVREYSAAATERATEIAGSAREAAEQVAGQVSDQARAGYIEAQRMVRKKPAESLAVCFGVGVLVGVVGGLILRSR